MRISRNIDAAERHVFAIIDEKLSNEKFVRHA